MPLDEKWKWTSAHQVSKTPTSLPTVTTYHFFFFPILSRGMKWVSMSE
jgi:hypothetical protein